ncbi:MAG: hypothetical protein KF819_25455 [Labilithrix sp.]|nr:hypothetical protein [Labilithrix sp.]
MAKLFATQLLSLQTAFSDLKRQALEQPFLLAGTPGTVTTRTVSGSDFFYRQFYASTGAKAAEYIGSVTDPRAAARAGQIREQIEVANATLEIARMLARAGYHRVDARTDAILAGLANNGFFRAGGVLVGSHAYGAILNELGARTAAYATEHVDLARDRPLDLPPGRSFEQMLADSKIALHPVPQDRKKPSTSFKPPGADRLRVDLLVPTAKRTITVLEVRDLGAHATGLPYFRYLLQGPVESVVLGRGAVVPVNVPRPERYAWHKMLVSELRDRASDKKTKDVEQASVLFAILAEREPGALDAAWDDLPRGARKPTRVAAERVRARLEGAGHARAGQLLRELVGRSSVRRL